MWGVKLTGPWKKMEALLKNAGPSVEAEVRRATQFNALKVQKAIRNAIRNGNYQRNAKFTVLIKGSTKPLADTGELFKAITHTMISNTRAEVGVLRTSPHANTVVAVHEGAILPVTPAMRGLFAELANYSDGSLPYSMLSSRASEIVDRSKTIGKFKALKPTTTRIRIPGRPFIRDVIEDPVIQAEVYKNWLNAVAYAIAGKRATFK